MLDWLRELLGCNDDVVIRLSLGIDENKRLKENIAGLERTNTILHTECNYKTEQIAILTNKIAVINIELENARHTLQEVRKLTEKKLGE